ncbi:MAG: hypothetical protein DRP50_06950 [Thermotoga sp.]|nr:MAG: hypothetical protein DRP50_06950 [Thermotoga sp.]
MCDIVVKRRFVLLFIFIVTMPIMVSADVKDVVSQLKIWGNFVIGVNLYRGNLPGICELYGIPENKDEPDASIYQSSTINIGTGISEGIGFFSKLSSTGFWGDGEKRTPTNLPFSPEEVYLFLLFHDKEDIKGKVRIGRISIRSGTFGILADSGGMKQRRCTKKRYQYIPISYLQIYRGIMLFII